MPQTDFPDSPQNTTTSPPYSSQPQNSTNSQPQDPQFDFDAFTGFTNPFLASLQTNIYYFLAIATGLMTLGLMSSIWFHNGARSLITQKNALLICALLAELGFQVSSATATVDPSLSMNQLRYTFAAFEECMFMWYQWTRASAIIRSDLTVLQVNTLRGMLLATSIGACISPLVGFVSFKGQRVLAAVTGFFLVLIDVIFMIKCRRVLAEKVDAMKEGELSYSKAERYTRVIAKYSVQGSFYAISTFVAFCVWLAMGFYMGRAGKELKNGEQWVTGWMLVEVSVNFFIFMMGVSMVRMKLLLDKEARRERSIPATTEGDAKAVLTM